MVLFLADVLTVLVLSSWLHTSSSSLSYLLFTLPPGLFNLHLPRWPLLMCLFHVFLVPCFFRYISNYTAENTHTHTHANPPSPNRRWVQVSGDLFIFQHTQQICPVPIISLSTLTTLPTTKHWLTDWVTCSQACFHLCCVLKYIFITYQMLNGCSCRLNAKNETNLYTFFMHTQKGTDCIDTASVLLFVSFSLFIQKSLPACPLFSELHSPRSHCL